MEKLLALSINNPVINSRLNPGLVSSTYATPAQRLLRTFINLAYVGAGVYFMFMIIQGGYSYLTAGGDKDAVQKAQKKIQNACIGLVIVFAVYAITGVVERVFGFNILTFNIPRP